MHEFVDQLLNQVLAKTGEMPLEAAAQYLDYRTYLPEDILRKVDIASMAHGLEVRTPFVDLEVINLIKSIPSSLTIGSFENGAWKGKPILRALLSKHFERSYIDRPKQGFMLPLRSWFRKNGRLAELYRDEVLSASSKIAGFFDLRIASDLLEGHSDDRNNSEQLWQLLFLEHWCRHSHSGSKVNDRTTQSVTRINSEPECA